MALVSVEAVNGLPPAAAKGRPRFDDLNPIYPNQRFRLEDGDTSETARIIDLVSPIGKGQRGLVVALPKAGKTMVLATIARAIAAAYPEVHLMLVLVGERPEEVTRREDLLMGPDEHAAVVSLRRALAALDPQHALELLIDKTTGPNGELLRQVRSANPSRG